MSNEYALILVLFGIYLSECIFFPSKAASLFKHSILGGWRVAKPSVSRRFRLVVESLLPGTLLAESAPPVMAPFGICHARRGMDDRVARVGRPSIAPEKLLRAQLLQESKKQAVSKYTKKSGTKVKAYTRKTK